MNHRFNLTRQKELALSFFLLFTAIALFGQSQMSVNDFKALPNDMTARTIAPERDANGDLTALIKVATIESGFIFEGGSLGIHKAEQKEGEWWVYVPPGARAITIRHPRLGVIRNYAFPVAISAGSVYEMQLVHGVVETIVRDHKILSEFVIINSEPTGADVFLNNEAVGKTPFSTDKPEGRYEWRLERNLYQAEAGVFELKSGEKVRMDVILKPDYGSLMVNSTPEEGASITLNNIELGRLTPSTIDKLPKGEHTLILTHEWHETTTQKVTVLAGQTENITVTMKPTFAELTVEAESDESVTINGKARGLGKWQGRLTPGVYEVEIRKQGHRQAIKQITLKSGDKETLSLNPEPIFGELKVVSEPLDAEIYLNGQRYGSTPQIVRNLVVGKYELELRKEGFVELKKQVDVKEHEMVEVSERLSPSMELKPGVLRDITSVKIGNQIWMTKNLNVDRFQNGDVIPHAKTEEEWKRAGENGQPAWCHYNNDPTNEEKYGKLYNWYAVNDRRGLAPKGWHVPSDKEWTQLTSFFGGGHIAGTKMKSKEGWSSKGYGDNESGFSGLPGGSRNPSGTFSPTGYYGVWWSSKSRKKNYAWNIGLYSSKSSILMAWLSKDVGLSVRCLRD